jgi:exopolysaccharide biosynthesis polyprenyl glycosylphosphotransferase
MARHLSAERIPLGTTHRRTVTRVGELRILLLIGDLIAAVIAAWLAPVLWLLFDSSFAPTVALPLWQWGFVLSWVTSLRVFGGGRIALPAMGGRALPAIWQSLALSFVLTLGLFYFAPFFAPRGSSLLTLALVVLLTLGWRLAFMRVHERTLLRRGVAVLGVDTAARRAARAMMENQTSTFRVEAFLVASSAGIDANELPAPVVQLDDDIWGLLDRLDVDALVVGHSRTVPERILAELARCYEHGVEAMPATTVYEQLEGRVMVSALEADWYAELPTGTRGVYMIAKRAFDVGFALLFALPALVVMAIVALAVWRDSGRPVLLSQVRVGLRGEPFVIHKFRTMRHDAEPEGVPQWATEADDRVTRVGRFLRRTRLDEVPQLWDVMRGVMSVIGPRPERPEFVEQLAGELPLYRARALVAPGITGWAQVQYPYAGSLEANLTKLEYDLYYIRHLGPQLDVRIALRTILTVLGRGGR